MLIYFAETHRQFLQVRQIDGVWSYNPVNPNKPAAGVYLSNHQVFSNAALGFGVYLRNEIQGGVATKVHAGLKLLFSEKRNGRFLLHNDPGCIALTLDIGGVIALYQWLNGAALSLNYELPRRGGDHRVLTGFLADRSFALVLRATLAGASACDGIVGGSRGIEVGLSDADVFHLQMHCVGLAKLHYPSMSDEALSSHMRVRRGPSDAVPSESAHNCPQSPLVGVNSAVQTNRTPQECARAVYGVGMRKWHRRHLPTIEFLQGQRVEVMDAMIQAGNRGDFAEWDRIYERLHRAIPQNP